MLFSSCDSSKLNEIPDSQFVGVWKLVDFNLIIIPQFKSFTETLSNLIFDKYNLKALSKKLTNEFPFTRIKSMDVLNISKNPSLITMDWAQH